MTDVLVAGAGIGGCAAALALTDAGRQVEVFGLDGRGGLSGEWLHPAGVVQLRRWGVRLDGFAENRGFVLHPADGPAIPLPYASGIALSMEHHELVERLREAVVQRGVPLWLGERVSEVAPDGTVTTSVGTTRANLVVGADGRASVVRRALRPTEPPAPTLSSTAGFELHGVELPGEGLGHIFLGGPGPILAYRIGPDTVRLSLDVTAKMRPSEMLPYLREHYGPALPGELRGAFDRTDEVRWAANRFRAKTSYGRDRLVLLGDATGYGHPLAAQGMTSAVLDAVHLARGPGSYTRHRRTRSWTGERLAVALHRALTDPESICMRDALFHLWRNDLAARAEMMRLLAGQVAGRTRFGLVVARIAVAALGRAPIPDLARWLAWLCGAEPVFTPGVNFPVRQRFGESARPSRP